MPAFIPKKYGRLLAETLPGHITDAEEYDRLEGVFQKLIRKGEDKLSPEEDRLFYLLADLLEQYEARTLKPLASAAPADALRFLMEENDLRQADLEDIFGTQSAVSRARRGERRITIAKAKREGGFPAKTPRTQRRKGRVDLDVAAIDSSPRCGKRPVRKT